MHTTDARDMFPQAVRAVREVQPKAFIFENVKGLMRASFQNYFEYVQFQMEREYLKLCVWRSAHAVKTGHLLNLSG